MIKSKISIFVGGENKSLLLIVAINEVKLMRVEKYVYNAKKEKINKVNG